MAPAGFFICPMPAAPTVETEIPLPAVDATPRAGRPPGDGTTSSLATVETVPSDALALGQTYAARLRQLPMFVDEIEGSFAGVYRNMADTDPQIASSVDVLVLMTLAQEMKLVPRVGKKADRGDEAALYTRFIQANLARLDRSTQSINYEMDEAATVEGHKIAEMVFEWGPNIDPNDDTPQIWLKAVKTKPREAYSWVTNRFNDAAGVLPTSAYPAGASISPLNDEDMLKRVTPRRKLMVRVNHPRNNDPRGNSDLRDVYNIWWLNVQNWGLMIAAHAQFAAPTAVFTEAEQGKVQWTKSNGQPMSPLEAANAGLAIAKAVKSSAAIRLANGQTLEYLQATSATEQCLAFRELVVKEIGKAITNQQLATDTSEHQTGRAATTHQNILGLKPRHHQYELAFMWEHDCFSLLLQLNYGDAALDLVPRVLLGQTQQWDIAAVGQMLAQLKANGLVFPSQLQQIHSGMDMPEADQAELDQYAAWWWQMYSVEAAKAATQGTGGGTGSGGQRGTGQNAEQNQGAR